MASDAETVAAAEVIRNFGYWQQQALVKPLVVTHHGRARVMLISTEHYEQLMAPDEEQASAGGGDPMAAILENSDEGFVVLDRDFNLLTVNKTALNWLGVGADAIVGKTLFEFLGGRANLFESMLQRVFRTGEAVSYELPGTAFGGRRLSGRSFPYGRHVASVFVDISEEDTLREASDTLEALKVAINLLDAAGTAEIDGDGRIAEANGVLERLTGLRMADLNGSPLADLFEIGTGPAIRAALAATMADRSCRMVEAALAIRGGASRRVSVSIAPLERGLAVKGAVVVINVREATATDQFSETGAAQP